MKSNKSRRRLPTGKGRLSRIALNLRRFVQCRRFVVTTSNTIEAFDTTFAWNNRLKSVKSPWNTDHILGIHPDCKAPAGRPKGITE